MNGCVLHFSSDAFRLTQRGGTCSWDFGYLVALLGVEVGLGSAGPAHS